MPLECEHIRNEFSALLDNELNPEDRELVEEHLSECSDCLRELHGYKQVSDAYRYHHPVKAPGDFEARFHERLSPGLRRGYGVPWLQYALGTAAAIALVAGVVVWRGRLMESVPMQLSRIAAEPKADAPASKGIASDYFEREAAHSTVASVHENAEPASIGEAESLDAARDRDTTYYGPAVATDPAVSSPAPEADISGIALQAQAAPPASMPAPVADAVAPLEESAPLAANPAPAIPATQDAPAAKPEARTESAPAPEIDRMAKADVPAAAPARRVAGDAVTTPLNAPAPEEMFTEDATVAAETAASAQPAPEMPDALGEDDGGLGNDGELPGLGRGGSGGFGGGGLGGSPQGGGGFGGSAVLGQRLTTSDPESTPPADGADATSAVAMEMKVDEGTASEPVPGDLTFGADASDSRESGAARRPGTAKEKDAAAADKTEVAARSAKTWREREFNLREGVWREAGYTGEPIKKVAIPSPAWNKLLDSYTDLNVLCTAPEPVIVRLGNTWYEIRRTKPPVTSEPPRATPR